MTLLTNKVTMTYDPVLDMGMREKLGSDAPRVFI